MDLVRGEILPPILMREMHREARRRALVAQAAAPRGQRRAALVARLGEALILAGCRMQAAGLRLAAASPFAVPEPGGRGA